MFEENEDLVLKDTENVEETTEETEGAVEETSEQTEEVKTEPEKLYTEEDFNKKLDEVLARKIARKEARIRKDFEKKYGKVEKVLTAGMGVNSIDEATNQLTEFYKQKGIEIPNEPAYNEIDMQVLAKAEAEDIISSGYDEVVEEVDRLAEIGVENMTPREKLIFTQLADYRKVEGSKKELASIGVKEDILDSKDFKDFVNQFNPNTPLKTVYELYKKTLPEEKVEPIGSMKNVTTNENKDYYTPDEVRRLTPKQLDDPEVMKAVEKSMTVWYEKGITS